MDASLPQYYQSAEKKKRDRNWTSQEISLFANLLADHQFGFVQSLESRAVKKQANEDIFQIVAREFNFLVNSDHFIAYNEAENFLTKDGCILPYATLDMDIKKLRFKYNSMKKMWMKISSKSDKNSMDYLKRPGWYDTLDPIFRQYRGKETDMEDCDIVVGVEHSTRDKIMKRGFVRADNGNEVHSISPVVPVVESLVGEASNESGNQENTNSDFLRSTYMNLLTAGEQGIVSENGSASKNLYDFFVQNKHVKVNESTRKAMNESVNGISPNKKYRRSMNIQPKRPRLDDDTPCNGEHARISMDSPTPHHFVETLRVIMDSHRQQQSIWIEMENKREEHFMLQEEQSLAREKHFIDVLREEEERYRQHQLKCTEMYTDSLATMQKNKRRCKRCDSQIVIEEESQIHLENDAPNSSLHSTCNGTNAPDSQSCSVNDCEIILHNNMVS